MTALVLDTVTALQGSTVASAVQSIVLNGYAAAGDGGDALYARSTPPGPGPGLVQSADGAWWILSSLPVSVLQFGADRTGGTSAVAAFNTAIAWANARSTANSGVDIIVPSGTYKIDASLSPITSSNIFFRGSRSSVFNVSAVASVFTWSNSAKGGGIDGLQMQYPANPAATAVLITVSAATILEFRNLRVSNVNTLCVLGTDGSHLAGNVIFENVTGNVFNSGQPTFDLRWGSDLNLVAVGIFVAGVAVPTFNRTSTMTTVANTNFIQCTHGSWDSVFLSGGCNCGRYWHGVYVNAPGSVIQNLLLDESIFDFCSSDAISLNAPTNATGGVFLVSCQNSYVVSWSGVGILVTGNNPNEMHNFSGTTIYIAGTHAIQLAGNSTRNIHMNAMRISNPNRLATGNFAGIRVDSIVGNWEVVGGNCLSDPSGGFGWSAAYGIDVAASNDFYVISGANYVGTVANYNIAADSLQSTNRAIFGNVHADYSGFKSTGIYIKPSSTANWINTTPFIVTVTATGMDLGLGMDAVDFAPLTGGGWDIPPGHSMFVAYSGTSTMLFFVKP